MPCKQSRPGQWFRESAWKTAHSALRAQTEFSDHVLRMLCWQFICPACSVRNPGTPSIRSQALCAVTQEQIPQQIQRDGDQTQKSPIKLWKNQHFCCDYCRRPGNVHFRVTTSLQTSWILVCETCWPKFRNQAGYRYRGTRKSNRRKRRRP